MLGLNFLKNTKITECAYTWFSGKQFFLVALSNTLNPEEAVDVLKWSNLKISNENVPKRIRKIVNKIVRESRLSKPATVITVLEDNKFAGEDNTHCHFLVLEKSKVREESLLARFTGFNSGIYFLCEAINPTN